MIRWGAKRLAVLTQEKVEIRVATYAGFLALFAYLFLVTFWPLMGRGPWFRMPPFSYFYNLFKYPIIIYDGIHTGHVYVFMVYGFVFWAVNVIIASFLARYYKHARIRRVQ
jgi:hypothetical protein